jgi:hypothetical protein
LEVAKLEEMGAVMPTEHQEICRQLVDKILNTVGEDQSCILGAYKNLKVTKLYKTHLNLLLIVNRA